MGRALGCGITKVMVSKLLSQHMYIRRQVSMGLRSQLTSPYSLRVALAPRLVCPIIFGRLSILLRLLHSTPPCSPSATIPEDSQKPSHFSTSNNAWRMRLLVTTWHVEQSATSNYPPPHRDSLRDYVLPTTLLRPRRPNHSSTWPRP